MAKAKIQEKGSQSAMAYSPTQVQEPTKRLWDHIRKYELEANVAELQTWGLTVVPPEKAAPAGFTDRLREGVLRFIENEDGRLPDFETGDTHRNQPLGDYHYLVMHGQVFEEMMCQPVALTFLDLLLGDGAIIHANSALCKGPHDPPADGGELVLGLHSDNQLLPGPFHTFAEFCNITWALTEYSKEDGALAWVPGSNHLCRHPLPGEGVDVAQAVECPPGSMIVWHGNTWHGAFQRRKPGIRLSAPTIFSRPYVWPRHPLREDVTQEMLDRNPPRFAKLCGRHVMTNWRMEGPDYSEELVHAYRTQHS